MHMKLFNIYNTRRNVWFLEIVDHEKLGMFLIFFKLWGIKYIFTFLENSSIHLLYTFTRVHFGEFGKTTIKKKKNQYFCIQTKFNNGIKIAKKLLGKKMLGLWKPFA